jgi:hypothetical protein
VIRLRVSSALRALENIEPPLEAKAQAELVRAYASGDFFRWPAPKVWPSRFDFFSEFTDAEKAASVLTNDITARVLMATLQMWEGEVWSTNNDIITGLDAFVAAGVITAERKAQILAA